VRCDRPPNREVEHIKIDTQRDKFQSIIDTSERCSLTTVTVNVQSSKRCLGAIAFKCWSSEPWLKGDGGYAIAPSQRCSFLRVCTNVKSPERFSVFSERLSTMAVVVGGERLGEMGGSDRLSSLLLKIRAIAVGLFISCYIIVL
jgi:hypothetical protein